MRRLKDGLYALYQGGPDASLIGDLDARPQHSVPAHQAAELAKLAQGERDDVPPSELATLLIDSGLVVENVDAVDPMVLEHLARLGGTFGWVLPDTEEVASTLALLRRAHARRKIFVQDFGQTPCLPESGVARCLALRDAVGPGAKVLLIGDDDLLSLALAHLGFDVTAIDIDPLVVEFANRVAEDEGLRMSARVHDVLAPLPDEMVGAYDAVLTDPMSYENCQVAFLSRALAVVREGGTVLACVHPVARRIFARVKDQLPVRVRRYRNLFSAYYYYGYIENTYRSDLVELERTEGSLPYPADAQIPFEAITEGRLSAGFHGLGDLVGSRLGMNKNITGAAIVDVVREMPHYDVTESFAFDDGQYAHAFMSLAEGGHIAITVDRGRARASFDIYPFDDARERPLIELISTNIRGRKEETWYTDAPHIPPLVMLTRP